MAAPEPPQKRIVVPKRQPAGGMNFNPMQSAGADDAVEPAAMVARHAYKKMTAVSKNPVPLKLGRLGAGGVVGIVAESSTQQAMDATRGGKPSNNPYVKNLEKLGARMVGGATSGAVYAGAPGAIGGAATAAAVDIADNLIQGAQLVPQAAQLIRDQNESQFVQQRMDAAAKERGKTFDQRMRDSMQKNLPKKNPVVRIVPQMRGVSFTNKPLPVS